MKCGECAAIPCTRSDPAPFSATCAEPHRVGNYRLSSYLLLTLLISSNTCDSFSSRFKRTLGGLNINRIEVADDAQDDSCAGAHRRQEQARGPLRGPDPTRGEPIQSSNQGLSRRCGAYGHWSLSCRCRCRDQAPMGRYSADDPARPRSSHCTQRTEWRVTLNRGTSSYHLTSGRSLSTPSC